MTIDEAIKNREDCLKYLEGRGEGASPDCVEAVRWSVKALKALRSVSREQVEKVWRGEWTEETYTTQSERGRVIHSIKNTCSACGKTNGRTKTNFCPHCGASQTDEAVEMVMKRMETLYEKT